MGKFRTRVKKKGKRWIKGQSSISNPSQKTFRSFATNNFFRQSIPSGVPSTLTVDSLRKHDETSNAIFEFSNDNRSIASAHFDTDTCTSFNGSAKTFNTFASYYTCCTNDTFNKLFSRMDLSSALHKEMLAVIAAVTEVIKSNNGQENTVEYFAALVTTLDSIDLNGENDNSISAIVSLLRICMKHIPKEILQVKFSFVSKIFFRCLEHYQNSDNNVILKSLLTCTAALLKCQEDVVWNENPSMYLMYDRILAASTHIKSKIRKAGQHAVCSILRKNIPIEGGSAALHPSSGHTAEYCIHELESCIAEGAITRMSYMLNILKEIIGYFPKAQLKSCCETVLKLMTMRNSVLSLLGFQTFQGLFASRSVTNNCSPVLNAQIITALYDYQPAVTDSRLIIAWLGAMQEAFAYLASNDLSLCISNAVKYFNVCAEILLSEKLAVIHNCALSLRTIIKDCIEPAATEESVNQYISMVQRIFEILNRCLKYQYHAAWKQILHLFACMYQACGKTCHHFMIATLKTLAELRDTDDFPFINEVDLIFGFAIRSIGPQIIITEIPLQVVDSQERKHEVKRSWLLPLLRQYIKQSTLKCFVDFFLPLATVFRKRSEAFEKANDKVGGVTYDLLQSQVWALFPRFCNDAQDIRESFPGIAKNIGDVLTSRKDLRSLLMAALRKLITTCKNNDKDVDVIAKYAKNYLPILFNIYTTPSKGTNEEANRVACLETIQLYLTIADDELLEDLFNNALTKLQCDDAAKTVFVKESILDLTRVLLPYQKPEMLNSFFQNYISEVKTVKNFKEEKKYYRLLEELCSCRTENCVHFLATNLQNVKTLLLETVSTASLPSRGPRVRTMHALLRYEWSDELVFEFLPEAVMCCKEGNKQCRLNAFEFITNMATLMSDKDGEAGLGKYLDALCTGLVGNTSVMAASILALTTTIHHCKNKINREQFNVILNNICILATSKTREIVGPALGFLKLVVTIKEENFAIGNLELIMKTLTNVSDDCKRKQRQKLRDIYDRMMRRYGAATIIPLVPTHDGVTLSRLKSLKKLQDKRDRNRKESRAAEAAKIPVDELSVFSTKQKTKTMNEILAECDDEDDFSDDAEKKKERPRQKPKTSEVFLREEEDDIIDFTSANFNKNITIENPKKKMAQSRIADTKRKRVEFPTTADGRLIIKEENRSVEPAFNDNDDESIASDAEAESSLSRMLKKIELNRKRKSSDQSDEELPPAKYQAGGSGIHRKVNKSSNADDGSVFKSKKAKGDMKKKGKCDPYAYIPLSRNSLNRSKKKKDGQTKNKKSKGKKR